MTRKFVDCREAPSESNCSLLIAGEEEEVVRAATQHVVDVHGHEDNAELRDGIRRGLHDSVETLPQKGAFVQVIEFRTDHVDDIEAMTREWATEIGADRAAQWTIGAADRDRPGSYMAIVAFPDYASAMANSAHPATEKFAMRLNEMCDGAPVFRNLDVGSSVTF